MRKHTRTAKARQGEPKPTKAAKPPKPPKPYPDFPLTPHGSGTWCKSIRGKLRYFGHWCRMRKGKWEAVPGDGWREALDLYNAEAADLHADRKPRPKAADLTVADLCSHYLTAKLALVENGELSNRTFRDYKQVCDGLVSFFGKRRRVEDLDADDFAQYRARLAKGVGPVRLAGQINQARMPFTHAYHAGLIDKPVRYGRSFDKPKAAVIRKAKNGNGPKMFEAEELRLLIDAAEPQLRAMILLAANCGYGNADVGRLPVKALNLKDGWVDFARPKTGIPRRCPLWPETVTAIQKWLPIRPKPKDPVDDKLVFLTRLGLPWAKATAAAPLSVEFRKLVDATGIDRRGRGFYSLRHGFQTVGDAARDPVATSAIMGHSDSTMSAVYRERVDDDRLQAVVDHVRAWLFPDS